MPLERFPAAGYGVVVFHTMFNEAIVFVTGVLAKLVIGFATTKYIIYGTISTGVMVIRVPVHPIYTVEEIISMMSEPLMGLLLLFPTSMFEAAMDLYADIGLLGLGIAIIVGIVMSIPYICGVLAGLRFWPELFLFRIGF